MFGNPILGIQQSLSLVFDLSLRIGSSQLQLTKFSKRDSESDFTFFLLCLPPKAHFRQTPTFLLRQSLFIWFTKHWTSKGKKLTFPTFPTFRLIGSGRTPSASKSTTESQKLNSIILRPSELKPFFTPHHI